MRHSLCLIHFSLCKTVLRLSTEHNAREVLPFETPGSCSVVSAGSVLTRCDAGSSGEAVFDVSKERIAFIFNGQESVL
jgi:hypothetical protein